MQGCPFTCPLLNALVSIFTRSVQAQVKSVTIHSFVDDITLVHKNLEQLQTAVRLLETYLKLMQQTLNVTKPYTFAVNNNNCEINFQGQALPCSNAVKILGVKFYFVDTGVAFYHTDANLKFVEPALARIGSSNIPFRARSLVTAGVIVSKVYHGSENRQLDDTQERKLQNSLGGTVRRSSSRKRTPGVLNTFTTKGHILEISQASVNRRSMKVCRAIRNDPSQGDFYIVITF